MLDRNRPAQMRALSAKSKNPAINCGVFILNLAEGGILRQNTKSAYSVVNYSVYLRTCVENMW